MFVLKFVSIYIHIYIYIHTTKIEAMDTPKLPYSKENYLFSEAHHVQFPSIPSISRITFGWSLAQDEISSPPTENYRLELPPMEVDRR